MSRVIKFRVWDGIEYDEVELSPLGGYGPLIDWDKSQEATDAANGEVEVAAPDNHDTFIWEQFTGLTDSKGREIWEGDVVRAEIYGYPHWGAVEYVGRGFQANDKVRRAEAGNSVWIPLDTYYPVEVIGNIHEHPHLLMP